MRYTHLGRTGLTVSRLCLGTMNFGPETDEPTSFSIMDAGTGGRDQLLRHGQRLRALQGPGGHRGDRRALVRPGRRPAGEDGARHQALRGHGGVAQRGQALGAQHPAGLRRQPAPPPDRLHRPVPDAPRRPPQRLGRDLGGHGGPAGPGQDPLRRLVQLRRLAHRHGPRRPRPAATSWVWSASSRSTTSSCATSSARCCRRPRPTGSGVIPWSPLQGGLLGGVVRKERDGSRRYAGRAAETIEERRPQLEAYEDLCAEVGRGSGHRRAGLAADPPGRHRPHRRAAHARASRFGPARRRRHARRQGPDPPRRALPGPQDGARGLRLVSLPAGRSGSTAVTGSGLAGRGLPVPASSGSGSAPGSSACGRPGRRRRRRAWAGSGPARPGTTSWPCRTAS